MDESLGLLQQLGFTGTEAKAWLALAQAPQQRLSGYEVAKRADIPRANVYPVLKRLVDRRAVRRLDEHGGVFYAATPTTELLAGMRREQRRLFARANAALPRVELESATLPVYSLSSTTQVLDAARRLVAAAARSLFIAINRPEAAELASALREADARGARIVTLCMEGCREKCGGCCGTVHRCAGFEAPGGGRWLVVCADDEAVVAAELDTGDGVHGIETRQPLVVRLAEAYVRQSAALAVLGGELGERFKGLVSLQARSLLDGLRPDGGFPRRVGFDATRQAVLSDPATGL